MGPLDTGTDGKRARSSSRQESRVRARRCSSGTFESAQKVSHRWERLGGAGGIGVAVEQPEVLGGDPRGGDLAVRVAEVQAAQ